MDRRNLSPDDPNKRRQNQTEQQSPDASPQNSLRKLRSRSLRSMDFHSRQRSDQQAVTNEASSLGSDSQNMMQEGVSDRSQYKRILEELELAEKMEIMNLELQSGIDKKNLQVIVDIINQKCNIKQQMIVDELQIEISKLKQENSKLKRDQDDGHDISQSSNRINWQNQNNEKKQEQINKIQEKSDRLLSFREQTGQTFLRLQQERDKLKSDKQARLYEKQDLTNKLEQDHQEKDHLANMSGTPSHQEREVNSPSTELEGINHLAEQQHPDHWEKLGYQSNDDTELKSDEWIRIFISEKYEEILKGDPIKKGSMSYYIKNWLRSDEGKRWFRSDSGKDWLSSNYGKDWLTRTDGWIWLRSDDGMKFLLSDKGEDFLKDGPIRKKVMSYYIKKWLVSDEGKKWLISDDGKNWLISKNGKEWLSSCYDGYQWRETDDGKIFLESDKGKEFYEYCQKKRENIQKQISETLERYKVYERLNVNK